MNVYFSPKIYISKSGVSSNQSGVFASHKINKEETIETCPIIEIPKKEIESIQNSILINYVYFFGKNKERMLLALGFGSLYNHSYSPNANYKIIPNKNFIEFSASKNINEGEEITVNYNQESPNTKPLWFE